MLTSTPSTLLNALRRLDGLSLAIYIVLLGACVTALSNCNAEPDLWGHVQFGKDAWQHGIPASSTYTYTAIDHPWINHELVSEFVFAAGMETVGPRAMLIMKSLLGLSVVAGLLWRVRREGLGLIAQVGFALLLVTNLAFFWVLRPQLFSFAMFALELGLLSWSFSGREGIAHGCEAKNQSTDLSRRRAWWLYLAAPLFALWTNTHGAFLAGLAVFTVYIVGRSMEAWWTGQPKNGSLICVWLSALAASWLATLVNPYGIGLHEWLLESLKAPRPEIIEWVAPEIGMTVSSLAWLPFWILLAVAGVVAVRCRKQIDYVQLVVAAAVIGQAMLHRRHIPLAALLLLWWLPQYIAILRRRGDAHASSIARSEVSFNGPMRWAMLAMCVCVCLFIGTILKGQHAALPVSRQLWPVAAMQFVVDRQIQGNMVASFNWSQYVLMACGARTADDQGVRLAFDGRYDTCYSQEVVDAYFDFELGWDGPRYHSQPDATKDGAEILRDPSCDLVLIDRNLIRQCQMLDLVKQDWSLLYQDSISQLWGRSSRFDDPSQAMYLPPADRYVSNDLQTGYVPWPALPRK